MQPPDFIVHEKADNVGVIVVENIQAGQTLSGWVMATDASLSVVAGADIPIGHKVAIDDIASGTSATKYGEDIGKIISDVKCGDHVHTHNLKTKRW